MFAAQVAEAKTIAYSHLTPSSVMLCGLDHKALGSVIGKCLKFQV